MAASTNADSGYVITVDWNNPDQWFKYRACYRKLGAHVDDRQGQFGLNLKDNTTPDVGADMTPAFDAGDYKVSVSAPYRYC